MTQINVSRIKTGIKRLCIEANKELPCDVSAAVFAARDTEEKPLAKSVMNDICENLDTAKKLDIPICQDTGMAVIFIDIGQDVSLVGGDLTDAVNDGVAQGYIEGLLRLSVVGDPIFRKNTNTNTPAIIHTRIVPGNKVAVTVAPKGFGSENMSGIKMLEPTVSKEEIIEAVVHIVKKAGSNPCPPIVVGVGIGGDFEFSAILAKRALIRPLDSENSNPAYAELEREMLLKINELNIGPQGFSGKTTALKVNIEQFATHIAGLPVAVNIGCHVSRHKTLILD